jgi:D-beta-D-heptose 7-phosphate kinase/D-beta-D-heptose 1-phosphate adenosyltransferase
VALGAQARLVAIVGTDAAGARLKELLQGVDDLAVTLVREPHRPTTVKTRYVAANQQILRADEEATLPPGPETRTALIEAAADAIPGAGALVLSDYGKGALAADIAAALIERARRAAVPVVIDPKGSDYRRYRGADVVTPNRRELAEAVHGTSTALRGDACDAARWLIAECGLGAVLVTLGSEGMLLVPASGEPVRLAAEAREVFDVTGAGDTVVATVAASLAARASLTEAAMLANAAAGIVVGKLGTAVAEREELLLALRQRDLRLQNRKSITLAAARARVHRWREQGLRIGFTNGCFDLIHPGHVSLLAQARAACDRLIVGLNSDASVRRLKGENRPVQPAAARAVVLASLATVDAVVVFSEDTPIRLIDQLRPDVLVKGADYRMEQVIGADLVHGWGGQVLLAAIEPGYSTTATLDRLTRRDP